MQQSLYWTEMGLMQIWTTNESGKLAFTSEQTHHIHVVYMKNINLFLGTTMFSRGYFLCYI